MLAVLRAEQRNPASYLARLSLDVFDHYLVKQYTHLWLTEARCQATEKPNGPPLASSEPPIIKVVHSDWTWEFFPHSQVRLTHGSGLTYSLAWVNFRGKAYVYFPHLRSVYVFSLPTFQFIRQKNDKNYLRFCGTSQGDLVKCTYQNQIMTFTLISCADLRRQSISLPVPRSGYSICDFGLVYYFIDKENTLIIYEVVSQACLGEFTWDSKDKPCLWLRATIRAPGQITLTNYMKEITLTLIYAKDINMISPVNLS